MTTEVPAVLPAFNLGVSLLSLAFVFAVTRIERVPRFIGYALVLAAITMSLGVAFQLGMIPAAIWVEFGAGSRLLILLCLTVCLVKR